MERYKKTQHNVNLLMVLVITIYMIVDINYDCNQIIGKVLGKVLFLCLFNQCYLIKVPRIKIKL